MLPKPSHEHVRDGQNVLHRLVFTIGLSSTLPALQLNTISVAPRLCAACTARLNVHAPPQGLDRSRFVEHR